MGDHPPALPTQPHQTGLWFQSSSIPCQSQAHQPAKKQIGFSLVSGKEDYAKQQHLAGPEQQRLEGREELGAIINQQQLDL